MMKLQGTYIEEAQSGHDKGDLETKESLNRRGWIYILILRDQYIFDINCTCDY